MFTLERIISSEDIEPVYNHVHHAKAICFLEEARLRYLEHIGFPNDVLLAKNLFFVITRIEVDYKRELFEELVVVTCESPKVDGRRMSVNQRILKKNGKVAVEAHVQFMCLDRSRGRGVEPPEDLREAFLAS
ncbi:MAG: acyl-CoA thioesterase [Bdellovibrionales bacterium]|nr:acyl-CoA thioesterase [Bdellovibrionales bacterium]